MSLVDFAFDYSSVLGTRQPKSVSSLALLRSFRAERTKRRSNPGVCPPCRVRPRAIEGGRRRGEERL